VPRRGHVGEGPWPAKLKQGRGRGRVCVTRARQTAHTTGWPRRCRPAAPRQEGAGNRCGGREAGRGRPSVGSAERIGWRAGPQEEGALAWIQRPQEAGALAALWRRAAVGLCGGRAAVGLCGGVQLLGTWMVVDGKDQLC
jgi:hypothetical protein